MRRRSVKPRALAPIHRGGKIRRRRLRVKLPKPPRLTKAEIERRARRIADQWLAEINKPLDPHHSGAVISSLAREAAREWDTGYWLYGSAHECALRIVRKYRWDVPQAVWDMLSAWSLLDVCGAIRR